MGKRSLTTFRTIREKSKKAGQVFLFINALLRASIAIWLFNHCDPQPTVKELEIFLFALLIAHSFICIHFPTKYFYGLISLLELFLYQTLFYLIPEYEQFLLPYSMLCMFDVSICFSTWIAIIINTFLGVLWCHVMSLYAQSMFHDALDTHDIILSFVEYSVCAVVSAMFSYVKGVLNIAILEHEREDTINKNLNAMNRSMTTQMFSIKSEAVKTAKREVTKYIHDNVGYVLTNLIMMLQATDIVNQTDHDKGQRMLTESIQYSQQGLNEIRSFLRGIQSIEKSDINIQKEILVLTKLFERCTSVKVSVGFDNWPTTFTPKINTFILSFVKEGLTNAVKHSTPTLISIQCREKSRFRIEISISNNGNSQQEAVRYGIGLESINYELNQLGGSLTIKNNSTSFVISVSIPFVRLH